MNEITRPDKGVIFRTMGDTVDKASKTDKSVVAVIMGGITAVALSCLNI